MKKPTMDKMGRKYSKRKYPVKQTKQNSLSSNISDRLKLLSLPSKHLVEGVLKQHSHVFNQVWQDRLTNLLKIILTLKCDKLSEKLDVIQDIQDTLNSIDSSKNKQIKNDTFPTVPKISSSIIEPIRNTVRNLSPLSLGLKSTDSRNKSNNSDGSPRSNMIFAANTHANEEKPRRKKSRIPRLEPLKSEFLARDLHAKEMLLDLKTQELQKNIKDKEQELDEFKSKKVRFAAVVKKPEQREEDQGSVDLNLEMHTTQDLSSREGNTEKEITVIKPPNIEDVDEEGEDGEDMFLTETTSSMVCNGSSTVLDVDRTSNCNRDLSNRLINYQQILDEYKGYATIGDQMSKHFTSKDSEDLSSKPHEKGDYEEKTETQYCNTSSSNGRKHQHHRHHREHSSRRKKTPSQEQEKPKQQQQQQQQNSKKRVINVPSVAVRAYVALIMDIQRNCKLYKTFRKELIRPADIYKEPYIDAAYACWMAYMEYSKNILDCLHPYIMKLVRVHYSCANRDSEFHDYETKLPKLLITSMKNIKPWRKALTECMDCCTMFEQIHSKEVSNRIYDKYYFCNKFIFPHLRNSQFTPRRV